MPEPPIGIEPMTYALRGACSPAAHPLAAPIARIIALTTLVALGLSKDPFHEPFHDRRPVPRRPCSPCVTSLRHSHQDSRHAFDALSCLPRNCQLRQGAPTRDGTASRAACC